MMSSSWLLLGLQVLGWRLLSGQQKLAWKVVGDTTGAPPGCSAAAGVRAITLFFTAFNKADSLGLARATSGRPPNHFVFSTGRFNSRDPFVRIEDLWKLVAYARARARHHERLTLQQVQFNRWRGQLLDFGPIYFTRSADDVGRMPRPGVGKGAYLCGQGIRVINLGPAAGFCPRRPFRSHRQAANSSSCYPGTADWWPSSR